MRKSVSVLVMALALALGGTTAFAGDGAVCSGADKLAAGDKSACTMEIKNVASGDKSACTLEVKNVATGEKSACTMEVINVASGDKGACTMSVEQVASKEAEGEHACTGACSKAEATIASGASATGEMQIVQVGSEGSKDYAMTEAYTVGSKVKDFKAVDAKSGEKKALSELAGSNGTILIFWNQTCPFVVEMQDRLAEYTKEAADKGFSIVAIDAGVNNSEEAIKKHASDKPFHVVTNRDSKVAAMFAAQHTPEVFILDKDMVVQYHGAFDSGKKLNADGKRDTYVQNAVNDLSGGKAVTERQTRSFGCTVKYAEGVQPLKRPTA